MLDRSLGDFPGLPRWPWRAWAVLTFFFCQTHSALVALSLPLLSLGAMIALLSGEFASARRSLSRLEWALLAFLCAFVLASLWGQNSARSLALTGAIWPTVVLYVLLRDQALSWRNDEALRHQPDCPVHTGHAAWAFPVVFLGVAILILVQAGQVLNAAWQSPAALPAEWIHRAASPWLVVPNDWSWVMVCLSLLAPVHGNSKAGGADKIATRNIINGLQLAWFVLALVALLIAILLRSRGALLCAAGAAPLLILMMFKNHSGMKQQLAGTSQHWLVSIPRAQLIFIFLATLLVLGLGVLWDAHQDFALLTKWTRLNDTRFALWWAAWQIFLEHPWHGVGPHNFVLLYQHYLPGPESQWPIDPRLTPWPHQLFLEILASMGILGLTPTIFIARYSFVPVLRRFLASPVTAPLAAALLAFTITALLEASLLRLWTWLALALIFAAINGRAIKSSQSS